MLNYDQFKVLTFDCYGTLIDWETGILNVLRPLIAEHNIAVGDDQILETYSEIEAAIEAGPYKTYRAIMGEVMANFGHRFGFSPQPHDYTALAESIKDWLPFEDTVESLKRLKTKYELVILSNVDDDLFEGSSKHLEVRFDQIITAQQIGSYKPNMKNFEFALDKLEHPKEEVLHVAQSLFHDHVPAQQFGLSTVWINRNKMIPGRATDAVKPDAEFPDLASFVKAAGL